MLRQQTLLRVHPTSAVLLLQHPGSMCWQTPHMHASMRMQGRQVSPQHQRATSSPSPLRPPLRAYILRRLSAFTSSLGTAPLAEACNTVITR